MSDPTLSDIDLKNEMAWAWLPLNYVFDLNIVFKLLLLVYDKDPSLCNPYLCK